MKSTRLICLMVLSVLWAVCPGSPVSALNNTTGGTGDIPCLDIVCRTLDPLPAGTCEVLPGDASRLITGDILMPVHILRGGEVLVDAEGRIVCVGCDCQAQAPAATRITCPDGIVSPGLINSHDHIRYVHNFPYTDTGERYEHRHDWRRGLNGHTQITGITGGASYDQISWGELRFLLGGATSIVGSGSSWGFLRNLDTEDQEELGQMPVNYDTFPLGDAAGAQRDSDCSYPNIMSQSEIVGDDAFYPHVSEGIDAYARNEFLCVSSKIGGGEDLLEPQSAFIHALGLAPIDYAKMAVEGTAMIWSPRTNITLYGDTAGVTAAHRLGVLIALGSDWIPTGSMNMQRELQCADTFSRDYLDGFFDDRELWRMVTLYGAQAAAMDDAIGALAPGLVADLSIFDGSVNPDHRAVIDADPQDVVLVMRGGEVLYGDDALVTALAGGTCDPLDVCGVQKRLCTEAEIGKTLPELQSTVGALYPLFFCDTPDNEPTCLPSRPVSVNGSTVYDGTRGAGDADGDGIGDAVDLCPSVFNPIRPMDNGAQADFDGDGQGDACDPCPLDPGTDSCVPPETSDIDGDGCVIVMDSSPYTFSEDEDGDGYGADCDCADSDPQQNPGALEVCDNNLDDNCDGEVDEGCGYSATANAEAAGHGGGSLGGSGVFNMISLFLAPLCAILIIRVLRRVR